MSEDNLQKSVTQLSKLVSQIQRDLEKVQGALNRLENESSKPKYEDIPGVEGVFDGQFLVPKDGERIEVPANYAAKSRLVYGDELKMVEVDGKQLFKQLIKVPRKKSSGVLTKKEGLWFVLTDSGSYRISDVAADFNDAQINDEAMVFLPADNLDAPFASLDKILGKEKTPAPKVETKEIPSAKPKPVPEKKATTTAPKAVAPKKKAPAAKKPVAKPAKRTPAPPSPKQEMPSTDTPTKTILEEDDLV